MPVTIVSAPVTTVVSSSRAFTANNTVPTTVTTGSAPVGPVTYVI